MAYPLTVSAVRALALSFSLLLMGAALSSCNTTEGFGKDVKNTGQTIENTAQDAKH